MSQTGIGPVVSGGRVQDGGEAFGTRVQDECKASWIRVVSVGSLVAASSRRGVIPGDKCRVILGQAGAEGRFRGMSATRREDPGWAAGSKNFSWGETRDVRKVIGG